MARCYVINIVDGSHLDQYTRMYDYCHELLRSNCGSTVKLTTQSYQGDEGDIENRERPLSSFPEGLYLFYEM